MRNCQQTNKIFRDSSNFSVMQHARESLKILLSGRIPGKRARGAQRFTFINNFKHLYQNPWIIMGCCPKQNKLEKHHSTSRAGTAMIPKEEDLRGVTTNQLWKINLYFTKLWLMTNLFSLWTQSNVNRDFQLAYRNCIYARDSQLALLMSSISSQVEIYWSELFTVHTNEHQ